MFQSSSAVKGTGARLRRFSPDATPAASTNTEAGRGCLLGTLFDLVIFFRILDRLIFQVCRPNYKGCKKILATVEASILRLYFLGRPAITNGFLAGLGMSTLVGLVLVLDPGSVIDTLVSLTG